MADAKPVPATKARNRKSEVEKAQGLAKIHNTGYSNEGLDDNRNWRLVYDTTIVS